MTFKKLALASAIALVPAVGFSVENLDDGMLSDVTGQDGIQIDIATAAPITADIYIHDKDGITATSTTYSFDGAIVIDNFSFAGNVTIDIDAGDSSNAGSDPTLQVFVSIPTATIITGDISVANSQRDDVASGWGINTQTGVILSTMTIAMSGLTLNIQLGNEPQGDMIALASTVTGGITINSFALNDANSGGAIGASSILVRDNAGTDLTIDVGVNATASGLEIGINTLGATGIDMRIVDQYLGSTTAGIVGDVTVLGLNLNGTSVTISGK